MNTSKPLSDRAGLWTVLPHATYLGRRMCDNFGSLAMFSLVLGYSWGNHLTASRCGIPPFTVQVLSRQYSSHSITNADRQPCYIVLHMPHDRACLIEDSTMSFLKNVILLDIKYAVMSGERRLRTARESAPADASVGSSLSIHVDTFFWVVCLSRLHAFFTSNILFAATSRH